ncbi:hypothetical protein [Psychrobacillus sp. FSL K6-4046]|uniref:hypothetical protein n=1 Tax=Psychrobacillus sp. FSL K6-4046 TaxID=2921550 RepID=UPI00260A40CF|nr:hypothetical protein [uncultured Psychrobacillus sp.]
MKNNLFININLTESNVDFQSYNYWFSLIDYFITSANFIEFHVWNEEVETIEELSLKTNLEKIDLHPMKMVCFQGDINKKIINFILQESLSQNGEIKWFSLFLKYNGNCFFESSHWGSEINIENPSEKEIIMFKKFMPKNAIFHHFK